MARRIVGKINREMNREAVNESGPKTASGARLRGPQKISTPRTSGVGRVYKEDEDI